MVLIVLSQKDMNQRETSDVFAAAVFLQIRDKRVFNWTELWKVHKLIRIPVLSKSSW